MGVASRHHRNAQFFPKVVGQPFRPLLIQGQVLAIEIQEFQTAQLLLRHLRHMARSPKGVPAAHHHWVLVEQVHELLKGQKLSLFLIGLQPPI